MKKFFAGFVFLVIVILLSYSDSEAGVVIDPKNSTPTGSWSDPNENKVDGDYFISKDGLFCANKIWQVWVNGVSQPARKCRLPDGSWQTFMH